MPNTSRTPTPDFRQIPYTEFTALSREQKTQYICQAITWFETLPGEKIRYDCTQLQCNRFFRHISHEEYASRIFAYGPACYQFYTLAH